jgi:ABC-type branched-subunit amino acid transport system ATPase component
MADLLSVAGVSRTFGGVYAVRVRTVDVAAGV